MGLSYTVVDAFTPTAFAGNPASVIITDKALGDEQMQLIAREFNLAETAFLVRTEIGKDGSFARLALRWFTPTVEIPLCGHATLASAYVLFSQLPPTCQTIKFDTKSGELLAKRLPGGKIELEFPAGLLTLASGEVAAQVKSVIQQCSTDGLEIGYVGLGHGAGFDGFVLAEVASGAGLKDIPFNPGPLMQLAPEHKILVLTSVGPTWGQTPDFVSRVFAPAAGIPEDPVTGAAHCVLAPYWTKRLGKKDGDTLTGRQVSARGGEVGVAWDQKRGTVRLIGDAVVVHKGELLSVP
ncbi:Diaminopimelate epimerase-like protein [Calocera viscosa TUFC12733]|uniref:Diaminopimelate epimerase-like protein n=1 Tax=Calocera viscosa (strain TUFC12733) TaxID=1330018 RepID=A0A167M711_CALVF|nr:Diaminopimelate epimerase-like protein [Calocera viscosa TUFC12733]